VSSRLRAGADIAFECLGCAGGAGPVKLHPRGRRPHKAGVCASPAWGNKARMSKKTMGWGRRRHYFRMSAMRRRRRVGQIAPSSPTCPFGRSQTPQGGGLRQPGVGEQSQNVYENKGSMAGADIAFECLRCAGGAGSVKLHPPARLVPSGDRRPHKSGVCASPAWGNKARMSKKTMGWGWRRHCFRMSAMRRRRRVGQIAPSGTTCPFGRSQTPQGGGLRQPGVL